MTVQDVDPDTFYAVGKGLFEKAGKLYDAFNVNVAILGDTAAMAGTDDTGTAWAASYDQRVGEILAAVNDLTRAMDNYGGVVIQAGYNHAVAEHNATLGNTEPAPVKPPEPVSAAGVLTAPPSAGGPGSGLLDNVGLMQQVGVPVPDGDTAKVSKAGEAWDRLATVYQTTTVAEGLGVDARAFRETRSPEVEYIVSDLDELRQATSAVLDGCAELAQSCRDYKAALDDLRSTLERILEDLAVELAATVAIGVAASFVSFGAGAVAATAKAAHSVTKFARIIAEAIGAWRISKNISKGVKSAHDIAGVRTKLQRIKNLGRKNKPEEKPPAPTPPPPPGVPAGWTARPADNGMGTVYQQPGSLGNSNSMRIMEPGADPRYPNGYVKFTNEHNQPINLDGKPGTRADTHIPRNPDGTYPIPKGWP
ncbi:WXG100-like domain-containing protein [Mycolicibacterium vanbaalenii]|uniref:Outer membrane channel protein CpnT-like N-terminal domain-containing protein n=1 Tax=Mycolicibacterium vanbaalenii (strain DSM 7251 / JCM 13017 / BCRC 16820 / KCTC 9966 / NRRL B-24157 / PYR-1) TaxID=350058 RepID=A1T454_MYCVP|nr:hypothetical protein [Mycolicibacterium vanbaalenii]ABM11954.1 hypothetical protein Mvan_1118 [Mycolicibacterium vanbaalenii PYR-1]MCV7129925.1 hypothetical protein [Mycolicibacterium vanbaalenii PYR-1]